MKPRCSTNIVHGFLPEQKLIKKRVKVTFEKEDFCRMTQEKRKRSKRKTVSFLEAFDINPAESPAYFP